MLEVALGLYGTLAARVGAVMFPPKPRGANERNDRDAGSLPSGSQVPRTDDA